MLESVFWWISNLSNSSRKKLSLRRVFKLNADMNIVHFCLHITHCLYWQSGIFYWPAGYNQINLVQTLGISSARFCSYETVSLALNEDEWLWCKCNIYVLMIYSMCWFYTIWQHSYEGVVEVNGLVQRGRPLLSLSSFLPQASLELQVNTLILSIIFNDQSFRNKMCSY